MDKLIFYPNEKQKTAWLEGIAALCRIFWGPDADLCQAILHEDFYRPFESLEFVADYTSSNTLSEFKSLAGNFTDSGSLCDALEEEYVRLFVSGRRGIAAPLFQSCYEFEKAPLMGPSATRMKHRLEAKGRKR